MDLMWLKQPTTLWWQPAEVIIHPSSAFHGVTICMWFGIAKRVGCSGPRDTAKARTAHMQSQWTPMETLSSPVLMVTAISTWLPLTRDSGRCFILALFPSPAPQALECDDP